MLSRLSIRAKLTIAFASAFLLMLVLVAAFVYTRVSTDSTDAIDDGLRSRANDIATVAKSGGDIPERLTGGLFESQDGFSQILAPDGRVIASTLHLGADPAVDAELASRAAAGPATIEGIHVHGVEADSRILARPQVTPHGTVIVVAGTSTADRGEELASIVKAFAIGAPVAIVGASVLAFLLAGRAMAPVSRMRRRADEISLKHEGERLPLPAADDEIRRLGQTLNAMLDRIEAVLDRERVFVADASHELRTPLAILRAEIELAVRPGSSPDQMRAALVSVAEEVDRLSQLAEDLLVIARSDQGRLPISVEPVDLGELVERVRRRFERRARDAGKELVVDPSAELVVDIDPLRFDQALGNLVDNAIRHGGREIRLSASRANGVVALQVSDNGAGFPAGFEADAFDRFTVAAGGRSGGGSGLGLAIVKAIAVAHGGDVAAESEPTRVSITLPGG